MLRAAVVGAGFVGAIHARALNAHPGIELVAICSRTAPKTQALAGKYEAAAFSSVTEMMSQSKLDLVCVATGNKDHFEPTMTALAAGAHVFVEKPMAFELEDARRMIEASAHFEVALGVNFNHRFSAPYRRALDFLHAGEIGTPCYLAMKFAGDLYKELDDPQAQLVETQGHSFDLLRLFGGEIEDVSGFLADPRAIGVYTSAAIALQFESGAVGTLLGSWDSSYEHPGAQHLEVTGTKGRIEVDNVIDSVRLYRHDEGAYSEWRPGLFSTEHRDFWMTIDAHLHAFIDAISEGRPPPVTGEDGLKALELSYGALASFEKRRAIPMGSSTWTSP
ncbi:MAG: Gfo/Idh/MocA family oxidoreductase [Actinobacteria bacterium]|nr:Gfo/Idh/MocA family oxidoreductase [Actinomycetota bacterium]